jgi:ribosomal protein S18 acetylase RimI-like enzyme
MSAAPLALIREVEERAFHAWPAAVVRPLAGWRLRFTAGVTTRRPNSVWPNEDDCRLSVADKLALVEDFYAGLRAPARYQICPAAQPPELDSLLAERGYRADAHTAVQIAPLAQVVDRCRRADALAVAITPTLDHSWLAVYCSSESVPSQEAEGRRRILQRIGARTGYAILQDEGQAVAVGLGVAEESWLGIFCMATSPTFRRRGAATDVLGALARWGEQHGATRVYLQVMRNNAPALTLYARAGFTPLYEYHYRQGPGDPG